MQAADFATIWKFPFEGSLENRERFYRALVERTRDLVIVVDTDGRILFENRSTEWSLGYTPAELVGRSFFEFIHPDDLTRVRAAFDEQLRGEPGPAVEYRFRYKDGSWRVLESVGWCSRDFPFGPIGIVSSRDITERKSLEAQFRRAQRMEVIGRMTSAVVHDFRNLLTAIAGSANRLLEGEPTHVVRESAHQLEEAVKRAQGWTERLWGFARDERSTTEQAVSVNQTVIELTGLLHQLAGTRVGLSLMLGASSSWVAIDQVLLEQVIVNLVVNARDAMPSGGVITIATSNVTRSDVRDARGLNCVAIEVSDTGVGMTEEVKGRIFEPFFTTKESGKGSGLGLAAVFSVVNHARGWINVDSRQGRGTTIQVTLPGHTWRRNDE